MGPSGTGQGAWRCATYVTLRRRCDLLGISLLADRAGERRGRERGTSTTCPVCSSSSATWLASALRAQPPAAPPRRPDQQCSLACDALVPCTACRPPIVNNLCTTVAWSIRQLSRARKRRCRPKFVHTHVRQSVRPLCLSVFLKKKLCLSVYFLKNYAYQFHPLVTIEAYSNFYLIEDSV